MNEQNQDPAQNGQVAVESTSLLDTDGGQATAEPEDVEISTTPAPKRARSRAKSTAVEVNASQNGDGIDETTAATDAESAEQEDRKSVV